MHFKVHLVNIAESQNFVAFSVDFLSHSLDQFTSVRKSFIFSNFAEGVHSLRAQEATLLDFSVSDSALVVVNSQFFNSSLFMAEHASRSIGAVHNAVEVLALLGLEGLLARNSLEVEFFSTMSKSALGEVGAVTSHFVLLAKFSLILSVINILLLVKLGNIEEDVILLFLLRHHDGRSGADIDEGSDGATSRVTTVAVHSGKGSNRITFRNRGGIFTVLLHGLKGFELEVGG
jgi:hypothetical protein